MKWTDEQQAAIKTRECNLLVSAGAGSGKTAVLVERIISRIINDKIDIDSMLVVTFTNAAASEMRERIADRLYKEIEKDESLQKQITLLSKANISTLHSFCLKVIRDNFFLIDLDPNFRIGDQVECELIKIEAVEELMEQKYDSEDKEFQELVNLYTGNRDDNGLENLILDIYNFIQSTPEPSKWLKEKCEMYNLSENIDFSKTAWGKILLEYAKSEINDNIIELQRIEKELLDYPNYLLTVQDDIFNLKALRDKTNSWDELYNQISTIEFSNLKACKEINEVLKEEVKEVRERVKTNIKDYLKNNVFTGKSEEVLLDMKLLYDNVCYLSNVIIEFDKKYKEKKQEKNILDFNDIEHLALKILEDNEDIRNAYRDKFNEILIDEYQDSNIVQETIIKNISQNNVFMVGDVKQSIYRFRHARPELFLGKYDQYNDNSELGKKVLLLKNFRSNNNILEATNFIFKQIMSREIGEIDYTEDEYLQFGADYYSDRGEPIELHLIESRKDEINEEIDDIEDKPQLEARLVADRIAELIQNEKVYDKKLDDVRKVEYRDIVILLRATTKYSDIFVEELTKKNIPVYADNQKGYFENTEVQIILSLLKILDNPLQDIPLLAVMRSQIGDFQINELTAIRLIDKKCSFYSAMQKYYSSDVRDEEFPNLSMKVKCFIEKMNEWREKAKYLSLYDLLWLLYNETSYYYYVSLLPDGKQRQANLNILLDKAKIFELSSYKGVFNFLNYIDNIKESNNDQENAKLIGENENVVRIMSIHKSKGLEFPIVFLSGINRKFNFRDFQSKVILHQDLGFGPNVIKYAKRLTYPSLAKLAIIQKAKKETLSEEMRILYVAMTRAREKLIMTGIVNDMHKSYEKFSKELNNYSIANATSFLDWVGRAVINKDNNWIIKKWTYDDILNISNDENGNYLNFIDRLNNILPSKKYGEIDNILSWKYPYMKSTKIPTKTTITEIKRIEQESDELNNSIEIIEKPHFLEEGSSINGANYGTLIHFVLQHIDYNNLSNIIQTMKLDNEVQKQVIKQINDYSKTQLFDRIKNSNMVKREVPFNLNIPARNIFELDANNDDTVMLQGIIDLFFVENGEIILVDFKSDYVQREEELIEKYKLQLNFYKNALEEITGMKVKEMIIYSLRLGKEILVNN